MTEGGLKRRTQPIDSCLLPTMTHAVCRRQSEADSLEGSEAARVSLDSREMPPKAAEGAAARCRKNITSLQSTIHSLRKQKVFFPSPFLCR